MILRLAHYYATRRRYRRNIDWITCNRGKTLKSKQISQKDYHPVGRFIRLNITETSLRRCSKNGGWLFVPLINRVMIWNPLRFKYFRNHPHPSGGLSQNLRAITLKKWDFVELIPGRWPGNSLNFNKFKLRQLKHSEKRKVEIKATILCLDLGGASTFQHFVGDCLPLIVPFLEIIRNNPDWQIGIVRGAENNFQEIFLRLLNLKNQIFWFENHNKYYLQSVVGVVGKPRNFVYSVPSSFIHKMAQELRFQKTPVNKVILFHRTEKTRNIQNFSELEYALKDLAEEIGFDFMTLNSRDFDLDSMRKLLADTKIVIAPHGGANYNMIFLPQNSLVMEFIPIRNTNSVEHLVRSSGANYFPIPVDSDFYDAFMCISRENISVVLEMTRHTLQQ